MPSQDRVLYWDTSALLSAIFQDTHSTAALEWVNGSHIHLISSLTRAEAYAVFERMRRERHQSPLLLDAAQDAVENGPWRGFNDVPPSAILRSLSRVWPLRGADLWHLALAKTIQAERSEAALLTFDERLLAAVEGEGLAP